MSAEFKVGEIAILQNLVVNPQFNGVEVVITDMLRERRVLHPSRGWVRETTYLVDLAPNGLCLGPKPYQLRRKPPKEDLTTWAALKVIAVTRTTKIEEPA